MNIKRSLLLENELFWRQAIVVVIYWIRLFGWENNMNYLNMGLTLDWIFTLR